MSTGKNEHASALALLGAAKGGRERASRLSAEDRSAIAKQAAEERWGSKVPRATHSGDLIIGGRTLSCAVLENGTRLLTQETFLTAIGRAGKAKGGTGSQALAAGVPPFLAADNLQPFIPDELRQSAVPIPFRNDRGARGFGYNALLLPQVCDVYLSARANRRLPKGQLHIADACEILVRGLARVGIIALVDEATGYQAQRAQDELRQILTHYIAEELQPWIRTFPDEFFRQVYRLHGWEYKPGTAKRTPFVGKLINKYIYEQLPPGVLDELRRRNPVTEKGYRRYKHFQMLTVDTGHPHLDKQIMVTTTLMRVAASKEEFIDLFDRAFSRQQRLPLVVDVSTAASTEGERKDAKIPLGIA
jgi:hypothetical protein